MFFPLLPPVQDADDQHAPVIKQVDDRMRPVGLQADGRIEFRPLAGHARIVPDQVQRLGQPRVVSLGMGLSEFPASPKIDIDNVLVGLPGRPIRNESVRRPLPDRVRPSECRRSNGC